MQVVVSLVQQAAEVAFAVEHDARPVVRGSGVCRWLVLWEAEF